MKTTKLSKQRTYRVRTKAKAIAMKGGKCERCGFDDVRALRFHKGAAGRVVGIGCASAQGSTNSHRAVVSVRREGGALMLNCSCIDIARDPSLNVNLHAATC